MFVLKSLLNEIVDYAGLFPPASLDLDSVVLNYHRYLSDPSSWMLGRLIIPSLRLPEFASTYTDAIGDGAENAPWSISALIPAFDTQDQAFYKSIVSIADFNRDYEFARVDAVEGKLTDVQQIPGTLQSIPTELSVFLEIDYREPDKLIAALAQVDQPNVYAKIRTGSIVADQLPTSAQVANFMIQCAAKEIGLKFTAGLHHPLRASYPLTYEPDSACATMHGFMNVFLAATLAFLRQSTIEEIQAILEQSDPRHVSIDDNSIGWGKYQFAISDMEKARRHFAFSFGSCSFEEPIADLIDLGWLESPAKTV